jgi:BirA family transcriptional regulator, biotin operon repressor / biotin---[acetyl-CoA-carboxylase] ligase
MTIATARRFQLTTVDSTNLYARQQFEAGEPLPFWIQSNEQTAGRGRKGRNWVSVPGNLYASLAFQPGCETAQLPQLALVTSIAVQDTVCNWTPHEYVRLKWPNDCLVNGAKISGILIETLRLSAPAIVIGCGINITSKPEVLDYPVAALRDFDPNVEVASVFDQLCNNLEKWLSVWNNGAAFAEIRNEWLTRARCLGETLSVRDGEKRSVGICRGLNTDGALLLEKSDGTLSRIYAGDVRLAA